MTNRWQVLAFAALLTIVVSLAYLTSEGQTVQDPPFGRPDAVVDLASREGVQLVNGQWRYHDVKIEDADSRAVGPDLKPSGAPSKTYDYTPHAGPADFDDSQWEAIDATTLDQRRSTAKVCFNWYRINVTIPEKVANFSTAGSTVAFEIVIDDYAEVWVDGKMPRVLGQLGGPVIKGFNAPNRVILTRNAQPGQRIQLAVFGINGPISYSPQNFIWIKSATLDFYKSPKVAISETLAQVTRKDPALDEIVPTGAKIEKLAGGFLFTEGPIWVPRTEEVEGYLLFSDPNNNLIYRWTQDGQLSIFMTKSGYRGMDIGEYGQPGSNGLTLDKLARLTINQHGNRRVVRMEKNGQLTVLADRYEGKKLNSPNDVIVGPDGALYFTDPTLDLVKGEKQEIPFQGVYRMDESGGLRLLTKDLTQLNGLAFSPDGKYLIYNARVSGNQKLFRLDLDTKKKTQITFGTVDETAVQFIDDHTVVFSSTGDGNAEIVTGSNTCAWSPSLEPGAMPRPPTCAAARSSSRRRPIPARRKFCLRRIGRLRDYFRRC